MLETLRVSVSAAAILFLFSNAATSHAAKVSPEEERWGNSLRAFEEEDRQKPPAKGGVLFLGSSSIRMWDLEEWFPETKALNRGFGGSAISDSLYFVDRIVIPYAPRLILFYAGDNDIAGGKTPHPVAKKPSAMTNRRSLIHDIRGIRSHMHHAPAGQGSSGTV